MDGAFFKQAWIAAGVLLTMVEIGMLLGYTTCLLPALRDPESPIRANLEQSSWIAASYGVAWIPGLLSSSYYMDRFGRKTAFILNMVPGILGLVLMYFSTNIPMLIAARVLAGITTGSTTILGAVVIGEYSSPVYRGMFLNLKSAAVYVGSTIVHLLGLYYHWKTVAILTLIPCLVAFGMICTWPESPSWLISENKFALSTEIFYRVRGKSNESTRELNEMINAQKSRMKTEKATVIKVIINFIRKFGKRNFVMPVINYTFAVILLETTCRHVFPAYAVQIISEISGAQASFYYTFTFDIIVTVSAMFSSVLIRMFRRRTLLFTTGSIAILILMFACSYLFLVSKNIISNQFWIPLSLFGLYFAIVNFACAPIPLALVGEIFPLEHRATGATIAGILLSLSTIVSLKTTPILMATVQVYGTFAIFGAVMAASLVLLFFLLPETKDRTLQEIEDFYKYGKFRDVLKSENEEATTNMIA